MNKDASSVVDSVVSGLSITRWNTYPRVREITSLDHLAFVAHVSMILAFSLEEEKYDIGLLLRKVIFSGFFTFKYSDMSSEVKHRLKELYPDIYKKLEEGVLASLLDADLPENIKTELGTVFQPSPEDDIITFAKTWCSFHEAYNSSLVYPEAYEKLLEDIRIRSLKHKIPEKVNKILSFDPDNQTDIGRFILVLHRLASSFRWNRSQRSTKVSVLSHTYLIAFFSYYIGMLEELGYDEITDMLMTALYHDIPEAITGDIITPTKKAIPGLEEAIEHIERDMVNEYLLSYIDETNFRDLISQKMLSPWKEKNGKLVKLADNISAYHEAKIESDHNKNFVTVKERLGKILSESGKGYIGELL